MDITGTWLRCSMYFKPSDNTPLGNVWLGFSEVWQSDCYCTICPVTWANFLIGPCQPKMVLLLVRASGAKCAYHQHITSITPADLSAPNAQKKIDLQWPWIDVSRFRPISIWLNAQKTWHMIHYSRLFLGNKQANTYLIDLSNQASSSQYHRTIWIGSCQAKLSAANQVQPLGPHKEASKPRRLIVQLVVPIHPNLSSGFIAIEKWLKNKSHLVFLD